MLASAGGVACQNHKMEGSAGWQHLTQPSWQHFTQPIYSPLCFSAMLIKATKENMTARQLSENMCMESSHL